MIIKHSYFQDPVATDYLIIVAYKPLLTGGYAEANRMVYAPPHANPIDLALSVPTPAVHLVRVYESSDGTTLGSLRIEFVATPSFDGPLVIPPLMIKVGRGIADRDPVDQATEVAIPSIDGNVISWVEQRGAGPLVGQNDTNDPEAIEWVTRSGGGIALPDDPGAGKVFNDGEEYWLYFEPALDGNVSAAISDLTELFEDHIQNTSNPHAVTKTQVGLGNIPNIITDDYQGWEIGDPTTVATIKAVHDLWASLNNLILYRQRYFLEMVPAGQDKTVTIAHNLNLTPDGYLLFGTLQGVSVPTQDNDCTFVVANLLANSFQVVIHNFGGDECVPLPSLHDR